MRSVKFIFGLSFTLITATFPLGTAQAGLLDLLFGAFTNPQPQTPTPSGGDYPHHTSKPKALHKANVEHHVPVHPLVGPASYTMMVDKTLKDGDAVMTDHGLRIFTGSKGSHHSSGDFVKLSEVTGLSKSEKQLLLAVEARPSAARWRAAVDEDMQTGRSVSEAVEQKTIVDLTGRTLRYVGP